MLGVYLILSTAMFLILFAIWTKSSWPDTLIKGAFLLIGVFGIINVLVHYGFLNSG